MYAHTHIVPVNIPGAFPALLVQFGVGICGETLRNVNGYQPIYIRTVTGASTNQMYPVLAAEILEANLNQYRFNG